MSLKEEDRRILVQLELEKADNTLSQVAVLQREGYWSFYSQMETLREKSDYNCFFNVTEADIASKVVPTSSFIEKVKQYIAEHNKC